jgi:ABC-2 type transport system ATP-binding protein
VARTLIHRPALVFLDEPTAGLDPEAAVALRLDIEQLAAREGTTVFLTTHNLAEAEKVCHLVGLIRNGELRAYGPPGSLSPPREATPVEITGRNFGEDVLKRLRARVDVTAASLARGDLLVEVRKDADRAAIVRTIVGAGGEIEGMRERERSLEDVYLDLVGEDR